MLATPHILTGAVIATQTQNLPATFIIAVLSHYFLDIFPHTDAGTFHKEKYWKQTDKEIVLATLDVILGFAIIFLKRNLENMVFVGAFFALMPDVLDNFPLWQDYFRKSKIFSKAYNFHEDIHFRLPNKYWYWGIPMQLVVIGGAIWYLLKF